MQLFRDFLQRVQSGRIDCRHIPQTDYHNRRQLLHFLGYRRNLVRCTEQKRSVNPKNGRIIRNILVLQNVDASIFNVVVGHL